MSAFDDTFNRAASIWIARGRSSHCYFPGDLHVVFDGKALRSAFLTQFATSCRIAAERAPAQLNNPAELYWTSFFCVRRERLAALKQTLRQALVQFIDDAIETEGGDGVVQLLVSLHE